MTAPFGKPPAACVGCGACAGICPTGAVSFAAARAGQEGEAACPACRRKKTAQSLPFIRRNSS
ncbi:MAG TPA: hypothetical protein DCE07_00395 [Peptococcaceae bacterium]|nr:hypothetical protein [Peptococcaceae bacterium]